MPDAPPRKPSAGATPSTRISPRATRVAIVALVGTAAIAAVLGHAGRAADPREVVIVVDAGRQGSPIPPSFVGFSIEYPSVARAVGAPGHPNTAFVALMQTLSRAQRRPPTIRIGGDSADEAWWRTPEQRRPRQIVTTLSPRWITAFAAAAGPLRAPVIAGLNLARADPANALALARALVRALPRHAVRALEIGNEPDRYTSPRLSPRTDGIVTVPALLARYHSTRYARDVATYAATLSAGLRLPAPIAIGGFAGGAWTRVLPSMLRHERGLVGQVSAHIYGLRGCQRRRPAATVRGRLLSDAAVQRLLERLHAPLLAAQAAHVPLQVTELNSVSCGGIRGVSDSFASALWATDALFTLVHAGAGGVNVHMWNGASYAPFTVTPDSGRGARVLARPVLYGILLFALATPYPSRLLAVDVPGPPSTIRAWATSGGGAVRVVVIDRRPTRGRVVHVMIRHFGGAPAALLRLSAPALGARENVTLGRSSIGPDGHWTGRLRSTSVRRHGADYAFAAGSAAMLTVPGVRRSGR